MPEKHGPTDKDVNPSRIPAEKDVSFSPTSESKSEEKIILEKKEKSEEGPTIPGEAGLVNTWEEESASETTKPEETVLMPKVKEEGPKEENKEVEESKEEEKKDGEAPTEEGKEGETKEDGEKKEGEEPKEGEKEEEAEEGEKKGEGEETKVEEEQKEALKPLTEAEKEAMEKYGTVEKIMELAAKAEKERAEAKNPRLFGKIKQWLDDPDHPNRKYIKIAAKVIGGAAAIGISGVLGGAPALAFAPALFGFGVKGVVSGVMEGFYCPSENNHYSKVKLAEDDWKNNVANMTAEMGSLEQQLSDGKISKNEHAEALLNLVRVASEKQQGVIESQKEYEALKSRHNKIRAVVSSVAGIGAGLLAGFPMGMQDFDHDHVRHMVQWGLRGPSFSYSTAANFAKSAFSPHFTTFWADGGLNMGQGYLIGNAAGNGMPLLGSLGFFGALGGLAASAAGRYFAENRRQGRFDKVTTEQEKTTLLDSVRQEWENFKETEIDGEKVVDDENKLSDILNLPIASKEEIAAFEAQISDLSSKERENIRRLVGQSIRNTEDDEISENFNDKADIIRRVIRTGPVAAETEETVETNEQGEAAPEESAVEVEEPQTTEAVDEVTTTENDESAIPKEEEQQERTAEGNSEVGVASAESGERSDEEEDSIIFRKVLSQNYYDFRASVSPYPNSALRALMVFAEKERRTSVDSARGNSLQAEVIENKVNIINEILEERRSGR